MQKPIIEYAEKVAQEWSNIIQEALAHLASTTESLKDGESIQEEIDFIVATVYKEGFRDGLALHEWIEKE